MALKDAGFGNIPVISLNAIGMGEQPGFKITVKFINRAIMALVYGDLFMRVLYRTRPYEKNNGDSEKLYKKWNEKVKKNLETGLRSEFNKNIKEIIKEFDNLELYDVKKPRVGVVGEILVKYHPTANNDIVSILEEEGAEAVVPDLLDFLMYCSYDSGYKAEYLGKSKINKKIGYIVIRFLESYRKVMIKELKESKRFEAPKHISELASLASPILSLGNQTGEGWFLTGEMIELIRSGVDNIACVQPFACLPNHVTGKGMIKALREKYPKSNIVAIDYDPGASNVNQMNRIKLMLSVAKKNLDNLDIENKEIMENSLTK